MLGYKKSVSEEVLQNDESPSLHERVLEVTFTVSWK